VAFVDARITHAELRKMQRRVFRGVRFNFCKNVLVDSTPKRKCFSRLLEKIQPFGWAHCGLFLKLPTSKN